MGIRIHKVLGYGITDYKGKKDPRFSEAFKNYEWRESEITVEKLIEWLKANPKEMIDICSIDGGHMTAYYKQQKKTDAEIVASMLSIYDKSNLKIDIQDCVTHQDEYGLKKVIVFQPFNELENWSHFDDMIDYEEAGGLAKNKVKLLKNSWSGLYPWSGNMYRFRGEPFKDYDGMDSSGYYKGIMSASQFSMLVGRWDKKTKPYGSSKMIEDLTSNWRCKIPAEIVAVLLRLGIVNDVKSFINELRPMIYTYWS